MKKLLLFCLVVLLMGVPMSTVSATTINVIPDEMNNIVINCDGQIINLDTVNEVYTISADGNSIEYSITMSQEGEITPPASIPVTRIVNGVTFTGTLYLSTYRYLDGKTTSTYEGVLYRVDTTTE